MNLFRLRLGDLNGPSAVLDAVDAITVGCDAYLIETGSSHWAGAQSWAEFITATDDAAATPASIRARLAHTTFRVVVLDVSTVASRLVFIPQATCDPVVGPLESAAAVFAAAATIVDAGFPIADAGRGRARGRDYVHARFKLQYADEDASFAAVVAYLRARGLASARPSVGTM